MIELRYRYKNIHWHIIVIKNLLNTQIFVSIMEYLIYHAKPKGT